MEHEDMTAIDVLRAARAAKVDVGIEGIHLVLRAPAPPRPAVIDALKLNKQAIVAILRRELSHWGVADWHAFFHERAGIAEYDGGLSRSEAEALAFDHCVVEWLLRHPVQSRPGLCFGCGRGDEHAGIVVPFGTEPSGNVWLHSDCWPAWHAARKIEAAAALSAMGIGCAAQPKDNNVKFAIAVIAAAAPNETELG
jgi:hypothetical protein